MITDSDLPSRFNRPTVSVNAGRNTLEGSPPTQILPHPPPYDSHKPGGDTVRRNRQCSAGSDSTSTVAGQLLGCRGSSSPAASSQPVRITPTTCETWSSPDCTR